MSNTYGECQTCGVVLDARNSYRGGGFLRAVNCIACSAKKKAASLQKQMEERRDMKLRKQVKRRLRNGLNYQARWSREQRNKN